MTSRRRFLASTGATALLAGLPPLAPAQVPRQPLVVMTAYPEEVTSRFEAAFEKAYPAWRVQFVWRMPFEAQPYLLDAANPPVDVYWSASPRTYAALHEAGALQPLQLDRSGLPDHIGGTPLAGPLVNGAPTYLATEMAGYGFVIAPQRLAELGLPVPRDWTDLTAPGWAGQIALPIPSRVGFAPVMIDIVLQAWGWERGWALWSEIAGNARPVGRGATFVSDEVTSGRSALGLTIDFFAASAIASGAPLAFAYPAHGGLNPGHVAVLRRARQAEGAQAFARFVLSPEGQGLLAHASIRKLAVRPSAYAALPPNGFNPFDAAAAGGYDYDHGAGQARLGLISALFDRMLLDEHEPRAALWQRLHAAEQAGRPLPQARAALGQVPLSEAASRDPALLAAFRRLEGGAERAPTAVELQWRAAAQARRQQAAAWLA